MIPSRRVICYGIAQKNRRRNTELVLQRMIMPPVDQDMVNRIQSANRNLSGSIIKTEANKVTVKPKNIKPISIFL